MLLLALSGLYQPRARWSIRSEALDLLRATVLMAVVVLAILFWLRLPDVSRTYLLILFPTQFLVTLATRVALRFGFTRLRSQGLNKRFVLVVGSGERALTFATKLESHRELGLEVMGFLDDDPEAATGRWQRLGRFDDLERVLNSQVVDEVAICLPFSRGIWSTRSWPWPRTWARSFASRSTCSIARSRRERSRSSTARRCSRSCPVRTGCWAWP